MPRSRTLSFYLGLQRADSCMGWSQNIDRRRRVRRPTRRSIASGYENTSVV